jgi:hypothetical protein
LYVLGNQSVYSHAAAQRRKEGMNPKTFYPSPI